MKYFIPFLLILPNLVSASERLGFGEVWSRVHERSNLERATTYDLRSQELAKDRAARHWFPHVYVDARTFKTNDPGTSFFSNLSQRSITMADFAPDSLNHPEAKTHQRLTLGAELPLFEGGMPTALSGFQSKLFESKALEKKAMTLGEYSKVAELYASLIVTRDFQKAISPVQTILSETLKRYSLGNKGNPVGYSGLLGMKALQNRLDGELKASHAKTSAIYHAFQELSPEIPAQWQPKEDELYAFTESTMKPTLGERSYSIQAQEQAAEGMSLLKNAERARFLPKVALFSENYWAGGGDRNSGNGYTIGAYAQWELFNATSYGAVEQARTRAQAMDAQVAAKRQMESIESNQLLEALDAAKTGIDLANQSIELMEEQTQVAQKLFTNGMINALQFSEVLSRRVDAILARNQAQEQFVSMRSKLMNTAPMNVPGSK